MKNSGGTWFLPKTGLADLIRELGAAGYTVIAPVLRDGVVCLAPVTNASALPHGLRDQQSGGRYQLVEGEGDSMFGYVVGPHSPKRYMFPPAQELFSLTVEGEKFAVQARTPEPSQLAFIGIRACELAAIAVQDKVFGVGPHRSAEGADAFYQKTRAKAFFVAVDCTSPGGTCFCDSMGTGPQATSGFDLALTELRGGFVVRLGSQRGEELAARLPVRESSPAELELAEIKMNRARDHMGRKLDNKRAIEILDATTDHPQFDAVARRCLSCGNCTMVCPTCFCSTVTDTTSLADSSATRTRRWESCFAHQFTYTTPGPVRNSIRGRYRHWLRHKLCTWWEQFGTSGCVGCGRCITWCPVGIDLTEEVAAIAASTPMPATAGAKGGPQ
jgi:ferredoxin